LGTAITIAVSLAQIGEFSFILAGLGLNLGLLPQEGQDLILAGALISILLNPLLFVARDRVGPWIQEREKRAAPDRPVAEPELASLPVTNLRDHAILVGYGRVGRLVGQFLKDRGIPFLVIEERNETVEKLRGEGVEVIPGTAGQRGLLDAVNLAEARWLISAIPSPFEAGDLVERARSANPRIRIIARAHTDAEVTHLEKFGADHIVVGEREIAREMATHIFPFNPGIKTQGVELGEVAPETPSRQHSGVAVRRGAFERARSGTDGGTAGGKEEPPTAA
jgi:CPA2 family monovalent cation:H+ antiporter-2